MNPPPYGYFARAFVTKFRDSFEAGEIGQAILLLDTRHLNTKWAAPLLAFRPMLCLPDHRLKFSSSRQRSTDGHPS